MVFYLTKILDEGTSNPIVARIGFQLGELLKLCRIDKENKDDLSSIFFDMMKSILSAHADASNLIEELLLIESELELKGLQIHPRSATIPSSIKLDSIKIFFKHANETLKLLAQALAIFFDKGWTEAKFDPILKYIKEEQVKQNEIWDIVYWKIT